ncbi:aKG-HExxH-type peptide beta-hydroxylase [Streptomyces orinoci]|uniref:HEXXH motif-containing putative peptide modification protein n=1 Tax=Streptomyces orinoci TaxID=67339 RepID=A0ABV3JWP5_STRON|nr:HEXXH motif-containing putative peptide modification protein [Streptomyces orinoci]
MSGQSASGRSPAGRSSPGGGPGRAVPAAALDRLARTRSTAQDRALLRDALHSRRLVLLKSLLTRLERQPRTLAGAAGRRFEEHWRLLERAEERHPGPARDTLDYPAVGNWLAGALTAPDGPEITRAAAHLGAVATAAALLSGISFTTELATPDGTLALPGIGLLETGAPLVRLTARARTARLTAEGRRTGPVLLRAAGRVAGAGAGWHALRRLPGGRALLDDLDPYRAPARGVGRAALPAAARGATTPEPWTRRWRAAWTLLRATDPERAAETAELLRCLVPLATPPGTAVSATLRAAPGAVLTTLPDGPADLAEVLVHETQHSKLAVLHDVLPLHRAGPQAVHKVAWRRDPRPLEGVLQGCYAHLALADFWARAAGRQGLSPGARQTARARCDSYRQQVAEALPILLESNELTVAGREFTSGMERLLATLGRSGRSLVRVGDASPLGDVR